jgi:ribose transport system substrate-binding protein
MRKRHFLLFLSIIVLTIAATSVFAQADKPKPWVYGCANLTYTHSFYVPLKELYPKMEKNYNVKIIDKSCDFKLDQQFNDIDNLIRMKADVIGVNPVDSVAIEPGVKKIVDSGIPAFSIANIIKVQGNVNAILPEYKRFEEDAHIIAAYIGFKGKVFYVSGMIGNWASDSRQAGFLETMKKNYPNIEVKWGPSDWNAEKAAALTEGWLASNDKIDAIVCCGETEGMAALQAVKNANRLDEIKVITDGGEPSGIDAVRNDDTISDGLISPDLFWWWIMQSAYKVKMGVKQDQVMPVPHIMTQATYDILKKNKMKGIEKLEWVTPDQAVDLVKNAEKKFGYETVKNLKK